MFDIGISLGFEGSTDEQIVAGLKAVANAVESVIVEDEKLSDAQKKLARSAVALEEQINRNIRSYMSSSSAIYAATAEELGYGEALKQKLDLLRQIEDQVSKAKKDEKDKAKAARDEKQAIRELQAEIKELERAEEARIRAKLKGEKEAADTMKRHAEERMALERQLAAVDLQIAEMQIADAQRVALEQIAWSRKSVAERIAALEELKLMQATPGITGEYIAGKFGAGAMGDGNLAGYKAQAEAAAAAAAAEKLAMEEIAWANKSWKERARITEAVTQHMGSSYITQEAIVRRFGQVAVEAAKNHDAHVNAQRANLERLAKDTHGANKSLGEALQGLVGNARARSEIIVLLHELMTGQFKRFSQSLIVLAEYGGLAGYVLSATGAAVIGLGIAFVSASILVAKGSLEFDRLNMVLKTTGDYSGLTTQGFHHMAAAISASHGTIGHAKEVMFALAETGRFTKDQISLIAPAVLLMSETSHRPIQELVKEFEQLGKSPLQASIALNEQFHYLTVAVYEQIAALEQQGNHQAAVLLATDTYAKAGLERADELIKKLGHLATAWHAVETVASRAINRITSFGAPEMNALEKANSELLRIQVSRDQLLRLGAQPDSIAFKKNTEQLIDAIAERDRALEEFRKRNFEADNKARDKETEQAALAAQRDLDAKDKALRTPQQKREANIADVYNKGANVLADYLRKQGVLQMSVEEAARFEKATYFQSTEDLLKQGQSRYTRLTDLAKKYGVDISQIETQTARIIREAQERNRDRVTPNTSFQETNNRIKDAEDNFHDLERVAKAEITLLQNTATSKKRIAADELASDRATAKNSNELHLVGLAAYEGYAAKVQAITEDSVRKELAQVELIRVANRARFVEQQAAISGQKTATPHDRGEVYGKASASLKEYLAKVHELDQLETSLKANGANAYLEAQADAFRMMNQDLEQVHGALDKAYGKMLRQYQMIGLNKEQVKQMDLQEKQKQQTIVESALIETQLAIAFGDQDAKRIESLRNREALLKKIADLLRMVGVLEERTAEKNASMDSGLKAGLNSYLTDTKNVFSQSEKFVTRAFQGMENSLVKFLTTGKGGFKDFANSIISDMLRIAVQQYFTGPIAQFFLAGLSPGKATGGAVASFSAQRVNEDGPELLEVGGKSYLMMGSQGGNVVPNNKLASSAPAQQISITIHQTVGDVATVSMLQQSNAALVRQIRGSLARSQKYAGETS